jgi:hypothetical protein
MVDQKEKEKEKEKEKKKLPLSFCPFMCVILWPEYVARLVYFFL